MLRAFKSVIVVPKTLQDVIAQFNRFADAVDEAFGVLMGIDRLDRVVLPGISLTGGTALLIPHKLNRQPVGWDVIDVTGGALAIKRTAWDAKSITLQNANTCVITIEVW